MTHLAVPRAEERRRILVPGLDALGWWSATPAPDVLQAMADGPKPPASGQRQPGVRGPLTARHQGPDATARAMRGLRQDRTFRRAGLPHGGVAHTLVGDRVPAALYRPDRRDEPRLPPRVNAMPDGAAGCGVHHRAGIVDASLDSDGDNAQARIGSDDINGHSSRYRRGPRRPGSCKVAIRVSGLPGDRRSQTKVRAQTTT